MGTFRKALTQLGFKPSQQVGIIQAMAYAGCFNTIPTEGDIKHLENVKKITIPSTWASLSRELAADSTEIQDILDFDFPLSEQELIDYINSLMQLKMLGKRDDRTKTHHHLDKRASEYKEASTWQLSCVKSLDLFNEKKLPKSYEGCDEIVAFVHASTGDSLTLRLQNLFANLAEFSIKTVTIRYVTNGRLTFNYEEIDDILAEWIINFNKLNKDDYATIRKIIKETLIKSKSNWIEGFSQLKNEILISVQSALKNTTIKWPKANPRSSLKYDLAAGLEKQFQNQKRELPNNSWPTVEHLLSKLVPKIAEEYKYKGKINLMPILVMPKIMDGKFRVAGTVELLDACIIYMKHNKIKFPKIIFSVGDNKWTKSAYRQEELSKRKLKSYCLVESINDGLKEDQLLNFPMVLEELAKTVYTLRETHVIKDELEEKFIEKLYNRNGFFSPSQFSTKEFPYGPYKDYICLPEDPLVQIGLQLSKI